MEYNETSAKRTGDVVLTTQFPMYLGASKVDLLCHLLLLPRRDLGRRLRDQLNHRQPKNRFWDSVSNSFCSIVIIIITTTTTIISITIITTTTIIVFVVVLILIIIVIFFFLGGGGQLSTIIHGDAVTTTRNYRNV